MNKLCFASIAAIAIMGCAAASAADLPRKAPAYAPPPPPFNWTGFYVGGHLGGDWGTKEWSNEVDPTGSSPGFLGSGTVNGFLGGLQAGYNYQINWVVLGIEGDFSWTDASKTYSCFGGFETCSSKAEWFSSLTGRIGGAVDRALFYLKGGVAWVHEKHSDSCPDCSATGGLNVWDASETRTGWTLGGGVEYAFTRNWSAKVEYDYMDFGTKTVAFTSPFVPENVDIQQRVHAIKAGVNYKFDWGR